MYGLLPEARQLVRFFDPLGRPIDTDDGTVLDIHRRQYIKTGLASCFICNEELELLIINEKVIGRGLLAGPLPEFAVIQINQLVLFWWATLSALNYAPVKISQVRHAFMVSRAFSDSFTVREEVQGYIVWR